MKVFIQLYEECKKVFCELCTKAGPSEDARELLRCYKPLVCPVCGGMDCLHGHGWRCRSLVEKWSCRWGEIWYWRLVCKEPDCRACLMVIFSLDEVSSASYPSLMYKADIIVEVVVKRLLGYSPSVFVPHPKTQKRWMNRFLHWIAIVLSAATLPHSEKYWFATTERLKLAVWQLLRSAPKIIET